MKLSSTLLAETKQRPSTAWLHPTRVILSAALVAAAAVIVWIVPLRPTTSAFEQRELAKFPAFSWGALASGTYFDDISLWFSDTFPARETFVQMSSGIRGCFGLQGETIHGTVQEGDEIPDAPTRPTATTTVATTTTTATVTTTTTATATTTTATPVTTTTVDTGTPTTTIDPSVLQQNQSLGAIIVKGDTAYEYYNFVRSTADQYIGILNRAGTKLDGVNVYSMIVPTSIDVMLEPDKRPANSSDQGKAIAYMVGSLSEKVHPVEVRDSLLAHRSEYLYFHTDHHWTARGAYYAFAEFAQLKGKTALPLSAFEEKAFHGFLGSFYAQTQNAGLKLGGDTVYAYKPQGNISMVYGKTSSSATVNYPVIADVTGWNPRYMYSTFIGGDNAYSCITNADITDGSSIVLVKESYGNAFAPYLATMYHKVYVLDYRYFTEDFTAFVKNNGVQDVLLLNNISATRNKTLINKLDGFVGK